ncbi:unnamed protein product, partial [Pylaiella littoralis]
MTYGLNCPCSNGCAPSLPLSAREMYCNHPCVFWVLSYDVFEHTFLCTSWHGSNVHIRMSMFEWFMPRFHHFHLAKCIVTTRLSPKRVSKQLARVRYLNVVR